MTGPLEGDGSVGLLLHIVGWAFVAFMGYAAIQSFMGWREYLGWVRRDRAEGKATFTGGRTASEVVMRGGKSYFVVMAIELGLGRLVGWLLLRP
jgi:hypothetical protein